MLAGIIVGRLPVQPVHHPRIAVAAELDRAEQHKGFNLYAIVIGQVDIHIPEYPLKQHDGFLILSDCQ
ncbi:hypothetical protein D3C80_2115210 [compost metagenome]